MIVKTFYKIHYKFDLYKQYLNDETDKFTKNECLSKMKYLLANL